jgi:minor extracellular serine protease Vpr
VTIAGNYIIGSAQVYASGVLISGGLCNATLTRSSYTGMVVLCLRGNGTFASKTLNVQNSGGVAIVIYNNVAGDFQGDLVSTSTIPAISISKAFGEYLMNNKVDRGLVAKVTARRV